MSATTVFVAILVGGGFALILVGVLRKSYKRDDQLTDILDLPYGERDVELRDTVAQYGTVVANLTGVAGKLVDQLDERGSLATKLERARIPMRTGEFIVIIAALGVAIALFASAITGQWFTGAVVFFVAPLIANVVLERKILKRRAKFEEQFPESLSLIASSLSAGHTFLRAISMMVEESEPPIAEEFARVVSETQLGDSLVDALDRMAIRTGVRDVAWVVQAIRIQQTVGGALADLLHTLADFIRARQEIRREVQVLTAEGRISAIVLALLPVLLYFAISAANPGYMEPMLRGWGYVWLGVAAAMVVTGYLFINRMVKVEV